MAGKTKNIAASVHQRLINKARESSRPCVEWDDVLNSIIHPIEWLYCVKINECQGYTFYMRMVGVKQGGVPQKIK